jgi:hypothetical protein
LCATVCYMPPAAADTRSTRQRKLRKSMGGVKSRLIQILSRTWTSLKRLANRGTFANLFMFCFILFTSIGAGMIFLPAGWVVAGVCCGIFGFLLGLE